MWTLLNQWIDNHFESFIYLAIITAMLMGYLGMVAEVAWKQSSARAKLMAWCDKKLAQYEQQ